MFDGLTAGVFVKDESGLLPVVVLLSYDVIDEVSEKLGSESPLKSAGSYDEMDEVSELS